MAKKEISPFEISQSPRPNKIPIEAEWQCRKCGERMTFRGDIRPGRSSHQVMCICGLIGTLGLFREGEDVTVESFNHVGEVK